MKFNPKDVVEIIQPSLAELSTAIRATKGVIWSPDMDALVGKQYVINRESEQHLNISQHQSWDMIPNPKLDPWR